MAEQTSAERFDRLYEEFCGSHPFYFPADEHLNDFAIWLHERYTAENSALRQRIAELEGRVRLWAEAPLGCGSIEHNGIIVECRAILAAYDEAAKG